MPDFAYKALTSHGAASDGRIEAASRAAAVQLLSQRGEFVLEIDENAGPSGRAAGSVRFPMWRNGITPRQRLALLRQLSVALDAGLTLVVALKVVADQADTPALRALATQLIEAVRRGDALSDAMGLAGNGRLFSTMQVSMVRAGETAGALEDVMKSLTKFAERDLAVREKLRSAAIYPVLVLALALVSIVIILTFILPSILSSLEDTGADLPLPTLILMQASNTLRSPWGLLLVVGLVASGIGFWRWRRTATGRLSLDSWKLRMPVLGVALRKVAVARFARVLGTLSAAGIGIVESMRIVRDTLGNEVLAQRIDHAAEEIVRGRSIADPLGEDGMFPPLLVQVVAMGERTGKLDTLLMQLADTYEKETEVALGRVMSILPAVLILGLAVVVAFILAAALLPIVNMSLAG
ncbi:MAG: type II secretion system F family protein [Planctomycetota bacterium]